MFLHYLTLHVHADQLPLPRL